MVKTAGDLSVTQLERLLSSRKSQLDTLTKRRTRLERELTRVEKRISSLVGRQAQAAGKDRRKALKRPKNEKSLSTHVMDILTRNKKGMSLAKLAEKVLESGYKTNSTKFSNVLYQCLYNSDEIVHDDTTGCYRLK